MTWGEYVLSSLLKCHKQVLLSVSVCYRVGQKVWSPDHKDLRVSTSHCLAPKLALAIHASRAPEMLQDYSLNRYKNE